MRNRIRAFRRVIVSRETVEVVGVAALVGGFRVSLGDAAALFAAGAGLLWLASFGGRR